MVELNPYEFYIFSILREDMKEYTAKQISEIGRINIRTAKKYSEKIVDKGLIKKKNIGRKTVYYYEKKKNG